MSTAQWLRSSGDQCEDICVPITYGTSAGLSERSIFLARMVPEESLESNLDNCCHSQPSSLHKARRRQVMYSLAAWPSISMAFKINF